MKNGVKFDYPVVEAITSILPLCDHFVVAVGDCNDGTMELIQSIGSEKIQIINTVWDPALKEKEGYWLLRPTRLLMQFRLSTTGVFTFRAMRLYMKNTCPSYGLP